ncbi:gamma-glutamylcyclotransferase [Deinococcus detaillensis]|uniref:Gamma-glutamylcyclotransferase n=1 Tax=Deinococcus detaillensis TaxID=2592048 RepID=A0A553V3W6_9DEIO|nr:gamma-glutamylcyclotransferase family protein [Deinococcus detaillensis]TSA87147.1 gamma-glutamylcyclotransferase [Deinococcus detaillensis]
MNEPSAPALPQTATDLTSVFVYGTLMPGERWEEVARRGGSYHAEPAQLSGVVLADLRPEGYPALFADEGASVPVSGWLYTYDAQSWVSVLPFLDDLEGLHLTPPLYHRVQVTAQTQQGPHQTWVYLYARPARRDAAGFFPVASGRWSDVPERHSEGPRQTWEE